MTHDRGSAQAPVCEFLMRQQRDGTQEWDLRCPHGTVTTEEVARRYSRAEILTAWLHMSACLSDEAADAVVQIAAIRELLGRLARDRWQCDCDLEPFVLQQTLPAGNGVN